MDIGPLEFVTLLLFAMLPLLLLAGIYWVGRLSSKAKPVNSEITESNQANSY